MTYPACRCTLLVRFARLTALPAWFMPVYWFNTLRRLDTDRTPRRTKRFAYLCSRLTVYLIPLPRFNSSDANVSGSRLTLPRVTTQRRGFAAPTLLIAPLTHTGSLPHVLAPARLHNL